MSSAIRLKLLRQNGQVLDITSSVRRLKWSKSIHRPWEEIDASLKIPFAHMSHHGDSVGVTGRWDPGDHQGMRPRTGDWLAVTYFVVDEEDHDRHIERAHTVCRVSLSENIGVSAGDGGDVSTVEVRVLAESWLHFLSKSPVMFSPDRTKSAPGLFSAEDLANAGIALLSSLNGNDLGLVIKSLLHTLGNTRVPSSVSYPFESSSSSPSGSRLGDLVRVAHKPGTEPIGRDGTCEQVPASSLKVLDGFIQEAASVTDLIASTFQPDADMVELFTDWEVLVDTQDSSPVVGRIAPVLIHRMVPFRTMPLEDMVAMHSTNKRPGDPGTYTEQPRPRVTVRPPLVESMFRSKTWTELMKYAPVYPSGRIFRTASAEADVRRVNAVTINNPLQPGGIIRTMERLGLPYIDLDMADLHGARMYQPRWHFFPENVSDEDYFEWMYVIAAQAAQFHMGSEVFERGTIEVAFMMEHLSQSDRNYKPKVALRHGGAFVAKVGQLTLTGYVEGYHHLIQVDDDANVHASTHINFSRGLYNETYREPHTKMAFYIPAVVKQGRTVASDDMWKTINGVIVNGEVRPSRIVVKSGVQWLMRAKDQVDAAKLIEYTTSGGSMIPSDSMDDETREMVRRGVGQYWQPKNGIRTSAPAPRSVGESTAGMSCVNGNKNITSIVLHYTSGRQSALALEKRMAGVAGGAAVHYHFIVKLDGSVYQLADARASGWALYRGDLGYGEYHAHDSVVSLEKSTIHVALETPAYEKNSDLDGGTGLVDMVGELERARSDSNFDSDDDFLKCRVVNPCFVEQVDKAGKPGGLAVRFPVGLPQAQRSALDSLVATLHLSISSHAAPGTPWHVSELVMRGMHEAAVMAMSGKQPTSSEYLNSNRKVSRETANTRTINLSGTFKKRTVRRTLSEKLTDFSSKRGISPARSELAQNASAIIANAGAAYSEQVVQLAENEILLERSGVVSYLSGNGAVTNLVVKVVHDGKITLSGSLSHHGNWSPDRWDAGGISEFAVGASANSIAKSLSNSNGMDFPSTW